MPLYEYRCESCGEQFEVIQKFSDQAVTTHEKCGGTVHRLLSAPALQFKGSGWYVNDYAKSSKPEGDGSSKKEDSAAKTSPSESSDTSSSSTTSPGNTTASSDSKRPASSNTKKTTSSDTKNE